MAKQKTEGSTDQKVSVEEKGGVRRASISIDAVPIPMKPTGEGFSGSRRVTLEPNKIVAAWSVKGARDDDYDFDVTINDQTNSIKGQMKKDGVESNTKTWTFKDFGLEDAK